MYRCERHTLSTGTGAQVSNRWMVQCCCCHGNRRAKGGGGEGWVLREERKWHKKGGREGIIKGTQFCRSLTELWGHIRSHVGEKRRGFHLIGTTVSIKATPFSSWALASLSVLVLPLKLYLYSCSQVLRLFRGSNPRGWEFIVYGLLLFVQGSYPSACKLTVIFLLISSGHSYFPRVTSEATFTACYQQVLKMCDSYRSKFSLLFMSSSCPLHRKTWM